MKDDAETLRSRLNRLTALMELARRSAPEDRARLERTIQLASLARQAVGQARQAAERARQLTEKTEVNQVDQRIELATVLTELRIVRDDTPK